MSDYYEEREDCYQHRESLMTDDNSEEIMEIELNPFCRKRRLEDIHYGGKDRISLLTKL